MDLIQLADCENRLMARVSRVSGLMEEKTSQLEAEGIFNEYRTVLDGYIGLAATSVFRMEAVKRAFFIAWYEIAEPSCFTGISGIAGESRQALLSDLNDLVLGSEADVELEWMLPWYYFIADYAFPNTEKFESLRAFLGQRDPDSWKTSSLSVEQFKDRGQMGRYWTSILGTV